MVAVPSAHETVVAGVLLPDSIRSARGTRRANMLLPAMKLKFSVCRRLGADIGHRLKLHPNCAMTDCENARVLDVVVVVVVVMWSVSTC